MNMKLTSIESVNLGIETMSQLVVIDLEGFKVYMNAKQRSKRGGKQAIVINTKKYIRTIV